MSTKRSVDSDEIDLVEILGELWRGRLIIAACTIIAIVSAGIFMSFTKPAFETRIEAPLEAIPPFLDEEAVFRSFISKFHSREAYEKWKKLEISPKLSYDDIGKTKRVGGYLFSKDASETLVSVLTSAKNLTVVVYSDNLPIIDNTFSYASFVSHELLAEYLQRSAEELQIIERRLNELAVANDDVVEQYLMLDRFGYDVSKGQVLLRVQHPFRPQEVSPSFQSVLLTSILAGFCIGSGLVLIWRRILVRQ